MFMFTQNGREYDHKYEHQQERLEHENDPEHEHYYK
jgi:hypothetical protein